jgi:hypothetical protein
MKVFNNLKEKIQETETYQRVTADTPDYHKRIIRFGLGAAGVGLLIKIGLAIFPATMPIGLASLAGDLIYIGLSAAGVSITVKKDKK